MDKDLQNLEHLRTLLMMGIVISNIMMIVGLILIKREKDKKCEA